MIVVTNLVIWLLHYDVVIYCIGILLFVVVRDHLYVCPFFNGFTCCHHYSSFQG